MNKKQYIKDYYNFLIEKNNEVRKLIMENGYPRIINKGIELKNPNLPGAFSVVPGDVHGTNWTIYIGSVLDFDNSITYPFITEQLAAALVWEEPFGLLKNGYKYDYGYDPINNVGKIESANCESITYNNKLFEGTLYMGGYESNNKRTMTPAVFVNNSWTPLGNGKFIDTIIIEYKDGAKFEVKCDF